VLKPFEIFLARGGQRRQEGEETIEVQAGLGIGVKKFRVVFVFESESALNAFINSGWEAGGEATAAAKAGDKGGDLN
jgi:lipid-binding SYLF domain-containing protein